MDRTQAGADPRACSGTVTPPLFTGCSVSGNGRFEPLLSTHPLHIPCSQGSTSQEHLVRVLGRAGRAVSLGDPLLSQGKHSAGRRSRDLTLPVLWILAPSAALPTRPQLESGRGGLGASPTPVNWREQQQWASRCSCFLPTSGCSPWSLSRH